MPNSLSVKNIFPHAPTFDGFNSLKLGSIILLISFFAYNINHYLYEHKLEGLFKIKMDFWSKNFIKLRKNSFWGLSKNRNILIAGKLLPTKWIKFFTKKIDLESNADKDIWTTFDSEMESQKYLDGLQKKTSFSSLNSWLMVQNGSR